MKINTSSNVHDSLYHYAKGLVGITSLTDTTTLSVAEFFRSANARYHHLAYYAWKNASVWNFDDSNATTLPVATTDLEAARGDYAIPTTALDIVRVEILNSDGNYIHIPEINKNEISESTTEFYETDGMPQVWYREANSIILKPAPATANVTPAAGLKVYLTREITEFGITDTATEPGFPSSFHKLIAIAPAIEFAQAQGLSNLNFLMTEEQILQRDFENYYAKRSKITKPRLNKRRIDTI